MMELFNRRLFKSRRQELRLKETVAEKALWIYLRAKNLDGHKFFRQYSVGSYIVDFYCPRKRLAIELDGGYHAQVEQVTFDIERTLHIEALGIRILRFENEEAIHDIQKVLVKIRNELR